MSTAVTFSGSIRDTLLHPGRGVVGLVEDLLAACPDDGLQLDWKAEQCLVRSLGTEIHESNVVPLRKSFFRAILARIAVLCNERRSGSVSPYGGEGELSLCPNAVFRANFVNTADEQRLTIVPLRTNGNGAP